jgi:hypothetical protein
VAELWLGLLGAAALRGKGEEGRARESCGADRGLCPPFYMVERGRDGRHGSGARVHRRPPLVASGARR